MKGMLCISLLFLLSILMTGCTNGEKTETVLEGDGEGIPVESAENDSKKFSVEKLPEQQITDDFKGYSITFTDETSVNDQYQYTFSLSKNEEFKPNISITNDHEKELDYQIKFFLNDEPISFQYEGEERKVINLEVPEFSKINLSKLSFDEIPSGVNNLLIVLFREPNQKIETKNEYVQGNEMIMIEKATLFVGDDAEYTPRDIDSKVIDTKKTEKNTYPYITHNAYDGITETIGKFDNNEELIWLNFNAKKDCLYYIALFVGSELVELKDSYYKVNEDGLASLEISSEIKQYDEIENFVAFIIENPLDLQVYPNGKLNENIQPYIQPSNIVTFYP
ncbi:hypothetical protein NSQ77_14120 [Oceanobacillus sp. FSL K6-2867]|uniref:hypothetical protein n=1 Tax=Oceanobacillus sp. FSL K6-2867 TaxID=2954748 RepID=UPI0030DB9E3E